MFVALLSVLSLSAAPATAADIDTSTFAAPAPVAHSAAGDHGKLPWFSGKFEDLMAKAKAENKLVFIDFWTDWCGWCKKLVKDTFSDDSVVVAMKDVLCIHIDAESETGEPLAKRYKVRGFPALFFLNPDGSVRDTIGGYMPPEPFKKEVARILRDEGTVNALRRDVAQKPADLDARSKLAEKLKDIGDTEGQEAQIAEIRKLDPEGRSLALRKLALEEVMTQVNDLWRKGTPEESPALVERFLETEKHPEILFNGWYVVGRIREGLAQKAESENNPEQAKVERAKGLEARMSAWKHVPEENVAGFGNELAWSLYEQRDGLEQRHKVFALEVARRASAKDAANVDLLDTLACVLSMNGLKDEALATLRKAIELDPEREDLKERLKEFGG